LTHNSIIGPHRQKILPKLLIDHGVIRSNCQDQQPDLS